MLGNLKALDIEMFEHVGTDRGQKIQKVRPRLLKTSNMGSISIQKHGMGILQYGVNIYPKHEMEIW